MDNSAPCLVALIVQYDSTLQRYARKFIKGQTVAASLVKEVFELVYKLNSFKTNTAALRTRLKTYTRKACCNWLSMQAMHTQQNN